MDEYEKGFGIPTYQTSDYWLGLASLHKMTRDGRMEGTGKTNILLNKEILI